MTRGRTSESPRSRTIPGRSLCTTPPPPNHVAPKEGKYQKAPVSAHDKPSHPAGSGGAVRLNHGRKGAPGEAPDGGGQRRAGWAGAASGRRPAGWGSEANVTHTPRNPQRTRERAPPCPSDRRPPPATAAAQGCRGLGPPSSAAAQRNPGESTGADTPGRGGRVRATAARPPPHPTRCSGRGTLYGLGQTGVGGSGREMPSEEPVLSSGHRAPRALRVMMRASLQANDSASREEQAGGTLPAPTEGSEAGETAEAPAPGVARNEGLGHTVTPHPGTVGGGRMAPGVRPRFSNSGS
ncbi:hypothetical protein HJG60_009636 [Phyllostomus discolor]|uniref:Uncharacterized protein n=1 Tax=Phyllostomus discolor TaxID=89673 RepID=A0A834B6E9_9CHIR|nr:hypothetical protein HJG60_009636 [Phyllostomus discolor]